MMGGSTPVTIVMMIVMMGGMLAGSAWAIRRRRH
jgi:hypothetical protein